MNPAGIRLLTLLFSLAFCSCAAQKPVLRDQLTVEKLRLRITKVRNAIDETRNVIAASRGAPYLPELFMRLAELLSEEARYHYMVAYEREQRKSKSLHVPQVRFLKEHAIGTYQSILKKFPDTHLGDRIMFNISHEQRELGLFKEMRSTLEQLVKKYPDSPYRAEALLVLGDIHFDKTNFVKAEGYYKDILEEKRSPLLSLAYYKLGWVYVNTGDCKDALVSFEKAIRVDRKKEDKKDRNGKDSRKSKKKKMVSDFEIPKSEDDKFSFAGHKSVNVQRESLVDLTYCYAQERKPEKAAAYLRKLAASREAYVAALSKMASRYAMIEQPRGAADVARELLRLAPDEPERLDDARMLHTAITRMKDYSSVGEDVYLIMRAMRRQSLRPNQKQSEVDLIEGEFELIGRDLATKSHEILMKGKSAKRSKWTKRPIVPEQTAAAYRSYLDAIPRSPHRIEILQNYADVLMSSKQFLLAGHRYREAAALLRKPISEEELEALKKEQKGKNTKNKSAPPVAINPKSLEQKRGVDRLEALYNAVVAYQRSLETEGIRGRLERASARAGLRNAGGNYLAVATPDKEKSKKIKFAIGQSYYDEGKYLEAIDFLTAVVYEYPQTEQGDAAVHMVLDSYRTTNDVSGLINIGRRFLAKDSPINPEVRAQVSPIISAAEQRRLDELSLAASGDQAGGMEILLAFADRYKNSELGERAMLSAFVAARAGGETAQLYSLGDQIIKQFPGSNQTAGIVSTMGRTAAARFEFDRAIDYLERAAESSENERAQLLITAGELREQLADRSGALRDYQKAMQAAGEGSERNRAAVHIADLTERGGNPSQVIEILSPLADLNDPEIASRLGLALIRVGKHEEAEEQLRIVVEGAVGASNAAQARANYGMAEIMLNMLEQFEAPPEIYAIEELLGLVDVVVQSYLAAARQADPTYSQAALARMAFAAQLAADKLSSIDLPQEITDEERTMLKTAMSNRATQLRADQEAILKECAARAKASFLLDNAGLACISGKPPISDPVQTEVLAKRTKTGKLQGVEEERERLARNPEDLDALRKVGMAFLKNGDHHAARLVLARSVEAGGDAEDLNILGVASYRAGDIMGSLDAFRRAKDSGSGAALVNLAEVSKKLGVHSLAEELRKEAPGTSTGLLLNSSRGASTVSR